MSRSVAAILSYAPRKAMNAFRSAWGPASSVQKRSYCPFERRVIASELEAIAAPLVRRPAEFGRAYWNRKRRQPRRTSCVASPPNTCPAEQNQTLISI